MSDLVSEIAEILFRSGCLSFGNFRIKSGILSPYYIDLSRLLSSPKDFRCFVDAVAGEIRRVIVPNKVDKLASIALKGALLLPSVACRLNLPCVIVRKTEKSYGVTGRIAGGAVREGERIAFFDDVITDGASKLEGIRSLEERGACVEVLVVAVDREQGGKENVQRFGYEFYALAKVSELVKCLFYSSHISKKQTDAVLNYLEGERRT